MNPLLARSPLRLLVVDVDVEVVGAAEPMKEAEPHEGAEDKLEKETAKVEEAVRVDVVATMAKIILEDGLVLMNGMI